MSGSVEGGKHARDTNKQRYGESYYVELGSRGGSIRTTKSKGFAANRELASRVGAIGGAISRRRPKQ